jgi:predicted CopG family antitoxin
MVETIRVDDDTYDALAKLTRPEETVNELLARLVSEQRNSIRAGAGLWSDTDAADEAKRARREMKEDVGDQ